MLANNNRRNNFDLDREASAARFASLDDQAQAQTASEISERANQASKIVKDRIVDGYGARNLALPASVWIAGSPVEAAEMLQRRGVEVVLMPIGQSLTRQTCRISDGLPEVDPNRGSATSWSLNLKIEDMRRTSIVDAEPVFTKTVGGKGYRDAQNSQLISAALGILSVCQLAHPTCNDWQLAFTREDHKTARYPHTHKNEISAVLGVVGPGVQLNDRIFVDGAYSNLVVPQGIAAFFKGPRTRSSDRIFGRLGAIHETPQPSNPFFPYEKRLAILCYASENPALPESKSNSNDPTPSVEKFTENYARHLDKWLPNWLLGMNSAVAGEMAKSFINLE